MIGRWGLYGDLMRDLRRAGFAPDDADRAARVAERAITERRDAMIRAGRAQGYSLTKLGKLWGITRQHVHRICRVSHDDGPDATPARMKLRSQQKVEQGGPAAALGPESERLPRE